MIMLSGWIFLSLVISSATFGQSTGQVQLYVSPPQQMRYILNMQERSESTILSLPAGEHRFTFWAPDRSILDTTITVIADSTIVFRKTLPPSPEFLEHRAAQERIGRERLAWRGLPLLATAVGGAFTVRAVNKHNQAYDALVEAEASYSTLRAPGAIQRLKEETIPARRTEFDDSRNRVMVAGIFTGVAAASAVYGFMRTAGKKAPAYQDKERLRFEGLVWTPGDGGGWYAAMTLPIR